MGAFEFADPKRTQGGDLPPDSKNRGGRRDPAGDTFWIDDECNPGALVHMGLHLSVGSMRDIGFKTVSE
jgi:hypothetical protein